MGNSLGFFAATALTLSAAFASEYHVSVKGSDSDAGTAAAPFRTVQQAASVANAGDLVLVHAGTYRETLRPTRSGNPGSPIVFKAAPGETVVLSGADPVSGWSGDAGTIVKAAMAWDLGEGLNQIFSGGIMLSEARFPDPGPDPLHPALAEMTLSGNTLACAAFTQPTGHWVGGSFHGWIGESWTAQGGKITASQPGQAEIGGSKTAPWFQGKGKGYVTGLKAALDAPGEWFFQSGNLSLIPPKDGGTAAIEAKRREWAIDLEGRSHVEVHGIGVFAASVRMTGSDCIVAGMRAKYLSHFTHTGSGYDKTAQADQGRNGILMGGSGNAVRASEIEYSAGTGIILGGKGNTVSDCIVHATDYQGLYSSTVLLEGSGNILEWSTLFDTGRDVVLMTGAGHSIVHNEMYNPGLLTQDFGVLYSFATDGAGTTVAYNWVHDNHGRKGISPCIYLDNGSRNFKVHHNVTWNCNGDAGIRVNGPAEGHQIHNNTVFNAEAVGTHTYQAEPGPYAYAKENNLLILDARTELMDTAARDFRLPPGSPYIDKGKVLAGFTEGYKGSAPDLGAYESGGEWWKAGSRVAAGGGSAIRGSGRERPAPAGSGRAIGSGIYDWLGRRSR